MNTSKVLNILLAVALVILSAKVAFMSSDCKSTVTADSAQLSKTEEFVAADSASVTEWKEITPYDIKNSVTLFEKDWMALAVGQKGDMNAMTIAWGGIGELWGKPVVTVYVRSNRYTYGFMERNKYFTVTAFPEYKRSALQYIGTHSGRDDKDKLQKAGLTPAFTELGNPIFEEANLAIECRIIYKAPFNLSAIVDEDTRNDYAGDKSGSIHTMYIGEVVNAWKK